MKSRINSSYFRHLASKIVIFEPNSSFYLCLGDFFEQKTCLSVFENYTKISLIYMYLNFDIAVSQTKIFSTILKSKSLFENKLQIILFFSDFWGFAYKLHNMQTLKCTKVIQNSVTFSNLVLYILIIVIFSR